MPKKWVINASPLIVLAKVDFLHLLTQLADEVIIPQAVVTEIMAGPVDDPARRFFQKQADFSIADRFPTSEEVLAWDLGAGETAVLSYALAHQGWTALIDDNSPRKCAQSFLIPVKGTLGVVIQAKQAGIINSAADVLIQIQNHGFRLNDIIIRDALRESVGEIW